MLGGHAVPGLRPLSGLMKGHRQTWGVSQAHIGLQSVLF